MLDPDRCWQAVCTRDALHSAAFVFAVSSTGIFCRPDCPARRPLRQHVQFFNDASSAQAAGFRPCKRCSPQGQSPGQLMDELVRAAQQQLNRDEPLTLAQLAQHIGVSASHLVRAFKQRTGLTPHAWQRAQRQQYAKPHASRAQEPPQATSQTPAPRRRQAADETLRYSIAPCALGLVLLAASAKGVCAVLFADNTQALEAELQQRFPAAQLCVDEASLAPWLEQLQRQIAEPSQSAQVPLDLRGTAFQQQIWQQLQQIPSGQTRTYAQLAVAAGSHPRAVARACASNPVALLVPCHRVIASNGSLSGYRWGIARKQRLLAEEQRASRTALK